MSIQSLPPRIYTHLGRFALTLLTGAVLALSGLLPSVAFAHTQGRAAVFAPDPNYVLDKAGVSVVRLVITYSGSDSNNLQGKEAICTGLGILVGSELSSPKGPFRSWVLTDGDLLSSNIAACVPPNATTETIQVLANNAYTQNTVALSPLGQVSCPIGESGISSCQDVNPTTNETNPASSEMFLAVPHQQALFSFQTATEQPYLTLASISGSTPNVTTLGLTNASKQIFSGVKVAPSGSGTNQPQNYLQPAVIPVSGSGAGNPPSSTQGSPTATAGLPNGLEPGMPLVDTSGKLAGMYLNSGSIFNALSIAEALAPTIIQSTTAPSPNSLKSLWDHGMDAYNQGTQTSCQQARTDFQQITPINANFKAATTFANLAQTCVQANTTGKLQPVQPNGASLSLMIILIAGLVVLLLVLILVTLLVGRMQKRRRELAQFAQEQAEARRLAETEHQRQSTSQTREILCPNCRRAVLVSDTMCQHCRYPLSPSASGLNVRLAGSGPLAATVPMPPGSWGTQAPPNASSVSDMPTIQFPPNNGEKTIKRQKHSKPQETVYDLQRTPVRNLSLAVGTRSDPGLKRKYKPNEDSLFAMQGARMHNSQPQQFGLFVIADGMGGHANGQDASRTAIQTIIDYMLPRISGSEAIDDETFKKLLSDGVQNANLAVHNRNLEAHADMGTTMTAALVIGATAYVANVGDSRTYRYTKDQGLSKVTMDHSVVASLVEAGIIQPDDIYTHPKRNQIYRSLGEKPVVEVDTFKVDVQPGDKLLLCSDGLWDMVRDPLIQQVMGKPVNDPDKTGQELIKAALQGGGEDNVTVIVVQFSELNTHTGMTGVQLLAKPDSVTLPNLPSL